MKISIRLGALLAVASHQQPTPAPSSPNENLVSVKEMLISGPPQLKMHSLAMIIQKRIPGTVDASYLDAFAACSTNSMAPIRSITARILGEYFIQDQTTQRPALSKCCLPSRKTPMLTSVFQPLL